MLLRGPQTPGELKGRTERLHPFASLAEVEETVERLIERELRRARRPPARARRRTASATSWAAARLSGLRGCPPSPGAD